MSKKSNQGHGASAPVPAPLEEQPFHADDPARVDPPKPEPEEPLPAVGPTTDNSAVAPPFVEPFDPGNGIPPVSAEDRENAAMAEPFEPELPETDGPGRRRKPLPEGAIMVEALQGVIVRVEHREAGAKFWMFEAEADNFAERGLVKRI